MTSSLFDYTERKYSPRFKGKSLACVCHGHTDAGSYDAGSTVEDTIKRMAELEMTHVSITEHGEVASAAAIHRIATDKKKKLNLKVIHGVEAYLLWPEDKYLKTREKQRDPTTYHITIGFKTQQAFEAYCKLTPLMFSEPRVQYKFSETKPIMTWEDFLTVASEGITVGTGCIGSWLNKPICDQGDIEEAKRRMDLMVATVGKHNIFDEWMVDDLTLKHEMDRNPVTKIFENARLVENTCKPWFLHPDMQRETNRVRREHITGPLNIPRMFSQDSHYAAKIDKVVQDNKRYNSDFIMSIFQHVKGAEEMAALGKASNGLSDLECEELIENTHLYAESFNDYKFLTAKDRVMVNKYPDDNTTFLLNKVRAKGRIDLEEPAVKERIDYELDILTSEPRVDCLGYMRLTAELEELAADNDLLMNVRGSAGGSLLLYGAGVSVTDPIKYNLPFERFLTKGRIASGQFPDVDMDFDHKDKFVTLLKEKYGNKCFKMSMDLLLKPRSAMKDVERFFRGKVSKTTEDLTKSMPNIPQGVNETDWLFGYEDPETGEHIDGYFETSKELQTYAKNNPDIWEVVTRMCGVIRQKSSHPCGYLITDAPVYETIPLTRVGGKDGELCIAYNPKDVEYVGGLKMDILGVQTLNTIASAFRILEKQGVEYIWDEFPHDPEVYKGIYHTGDTAATFQTKTEGITKLCVQTKPKSIEEVSNLIALYRPSCLGVEASTIDPNAKGNLVDYYVECANGTRTPKFIHPDLIPIFGPTMGVPLFQEQILRTFRDLGGYTYETAEGVRRAIGKKDAAALAEHGGKLKAAVMARGWTQTQADNLFHTIQASSRYGFNASHSTSYGICSYISAYLKHHHPLEYWCAELTVTNGDDAKTKFYSSLLTDILDQPDITRSHPTDWQIVNQKLVAPLSAIKGIGEAFSRDFHKFLTTPLEDLGLEEREVKVKKPRASKKKPAADTPAQFTLPDNF